MKTLKLLLQALLEMDNPGSCNTDSFLGNHPNNHPNNHQNKAMKDILVHYTRDEDTGLYTDVVYKGYIQHWHCGSGYQMAIILNTEGRFHRTTLDKIWVEKEDMPITKE